MRITAFLLAVLVILAPRALGQALPDLGSSGDVTLSPQLERRIGESIMREIRFREPGYVDDPEITDYLATLGARLTQSSVGVRYDFEFFAIRDHTINAFALPGGFIGVHTGLITAAEAESELASVLGHEIGHVTQRHIARMLGQQQQMQIPVLAAIAAAILLGRSRPDLASGAAAAASARRGPDPALVLARLRTRGRPHRLPVARGGGVRRARDGLVFREDAARHAPGRRRQPAGYLRTHPITTERIAGRAEPRRAAALQAAPRQRGIPAGARQDTGGAGRCARHRAVLPVAVRERRYASESAARYGLALAYVRAKRGKEAEAELARRARRRRRRADDRNPRRTGQDRRKATARARRGCSASPYAKYPNSRSAAVCARRALHEAGENEQAMKLLADSIRAYPRDAYLYSLQAKTYALARQAHARSTRRRPRSTCCRAACRRRSSSCRSRAAPATATSTSSR
jgi:predicted Zn-dependent protease